MVHGGKRIGAGRKAIFDDPWTRWSIGGRCEELKRAELKAQLEKFQDEKTRTVQVEWRKIREATCPGQKTWYNMSDHRDDIEFATQTDLGLGDEDRAPNLLRFSIYPPHGLETRIIRQVAEEVRRERGIQASESTIRRCWDEFLKLQRDLADEGT